MMLFLMIAAATVLTSEGSTTAVLFESPQAASVCLDALAKDAALAAPQDKPSAGPVCAEATVAALSGGVEIEVAKRASGMVQVKVLTGKHAGKIGWMPEANVDDPDAGSLSAAPAPQASLPGSEADRRPPFLVERLVDISPKEIDEALRVGHAAKGKQMGLILRDTGRSIMNALTSTRYQPNPLGTGFSIRIYTPITWIQQMASDAAKEYHQLTPADINDDWRRAVLRVIVYPDEPSTLNAGARARAASAQHVVLRDGTKRIVIQPLLKEPFEDEIANALGARAVYGGLRTVFDLDDLAKIRGPGGRGEFFVTAIGDRRYEKDFKVKAKHFDDLPGLAQAVSSR